MAFYAGALIFFVGLLAALAVLLYRSRKGKSDHVRERYAFRAFLLLVGLSSDTVYVMASGHSIWDIAAALLHIESAEPIAVTILSRILAVVVCIVCWIAAIMIYSKWSGPVSRRQHQMDDGIHMFSDFLVILAAAFKENFDLKVYRPVPNLTGFDDGQAADTLPWHLEFARIFSLMSNQTHINPETDWHPQQRCFISDYAGEHKLAIYCVSAMPDSRDLDRFLAYIRQIHTSYFQVIAAVKEGAQANFTASRNGQAIEYIFKRNALKKLVDFTEYYRSIDALYTRPLMERADVCIEDVYVDPDCRLETGGSAFPLSVYTERWLKEKGKRQLAVLGDFGQGKTLFSIHLTHRLIHAQSERVPILIPLRSKSPRNSSPVEILSYFAAQYGIAPEALSILNANGKLLLIFDGFDEMDLVGNDDIRKQHFRSLWKLVLPQSKVLITGRPNYFLSRSEMASALGFKPDSNRVPYCEGLVLQSFREEQIMLALRSAGKIVRSGIQRIIDTKLSSSFLDLISRPSHLFLVSQIWETRQLEQKYQNLTSAVIINEFLQDCFERQASKAIQNPYFYLSSIEREYFMVGIAARMYKMGASSISADSFQITIQELLELFPEELSARNPVFMNLRNGKSVREFADADDYSLSAIINDVRTCGVLVSDTANEGLCFAHKSFFDVLVAKFFLGKNLKEHNDAVTISAALARSPTYNPRLKSDIVVRKLLAELISAKVDLSEEHCDDRTRCRKIFEHCQKVISFQWLWQTPQSVFRRCMREKDAPAAGLSAMRWRHQRQSRRLLATLLLPVVSCGLFLIRGIEFSRYKMDAANYYRQLSVPKPEISSEVQMTIQVWPIILTVALIVILFMFLSLVSRGMSLFFREKSELILLTWYYACKENQIADEVIFQQFSEKYAAAFAEYVQGRSLTELQNQWERSRCSDVGVGKKQL